MGRIAAWVRHHLTHLLGRSHRILIDEALGQLAFEGDHGKGVPEQIVEVARHPQAFLHDRHPSQFAARGMHLAQGAGQTHHPSHVQPQPAHQQHQRKEVQPVGAIETAGQSDAAAECEKRQHHDHHEGATRRE